MNTDISASEVAAILGLSPWQTPMDVWVRKSGIVADNSSDATRRGQMLEDSIVMRWWREHLQNGARNVCFSRGPSLHADPLRRTVAGQEWVVARPDAILFVMPEDRPDLVMDAKSCRAFDADDGWGDDGSADIPEHYAAQLLWQAAAVGVERGDLAAFATLSDGWRVYHLALPESHQRVVIRSVADWRERHLLGEVPPPIDGTDGWSAHIRRLYPGRAKVPDLTATEHDRALARDLARVRARIAELSREARAMEQALQMRMGDAHVLRDGEEVLVTWRPRKGTRRIDADALRRDLPEVAAKYTTTGEDGRTFKLNIEEDT